MSSTTRQRETIPVKYEFQGSLRRTSIDVPPRLNQLRKKLAKSFPEFAHLFESKDQILRLVYTDDEGDEITIATNDELLAAYRLAQEAGKVLRFTVPKFGDDQVTRVVAADPAPEAEAEAGGGGAPAAPVTDADAKAASILAARQAAREAKQAKKAARRAAAQAKKAAIQTARKTGQAIHRGVRCDATGQAPIIGVRFHKRGHNYDLCEAAFAELSPEEQKAFERIETPCRVRDWRRGERRRGWFAAPFADADESADASPAEPAVHTGITCDASGMSPIVGNRYWKRGEDYDLCEAEYNKLTPEEQAQFVLIDSPTSQLAHMARFAIMARARFGPGAPVFPPGFPGCPGFAGCPTGGPPGFAGFAGPRGGFFGFGPGGPRFGGPRGHHHGHHHGHRFGHHHGRRHGHGHGHGGAWRRGGHRHHHNNSQQRVVTFVRDVTIPDGKHVDAGAPFDKTWLLRAPAGLPEGTALVFVGGNLLGAAYTRVLVNGGAAAAPGDVAITVSLQAPTESTDDDLRGFWRLQSAEGRRFGPRLWVDISTSGNKQRHRGISCDVSGQKPIIGNRYWKIGEDYDLCEAEFAKLTPDEQAQYRCIEDPNGPEAAAARDVIRATAAVNQQAAAEPAPAPAPAAAAAAAGDDEVDADAAREACMKFVADVTVPDGATVDAGSAVRKTWTVGTQRGWAEGTVLRSLDTAGPYVGLETPVPAVPAGSQANVSITLAAPDVAGKVRTHWGLFDAAGQRFGDQLWADFVVDSVGGGGGSKADDDDEDTTAAAAASASSPSSASSASSDSDTSGADDAPAPFPARQLLQQILAGINVAAPQLQTQLSSLLYGALDSGEFKEVMAALAAANINIE